jgi:hypothetical protein
MRRVRRASFGLAIAFTVALVGASSPARAQGETPADGPIFRLWLQPPLAGYTLAADESGATGVVNLAALSLGLELPSRLAFEIGAGAVVSSVGGEKGLSIGADAWVKAGWAPVIYSSRAARRGWDLQLASSLGYRYLERGKIVYEDYGVDVERVHAIAVEAGPMATHWSDGGLNLAVRIVAGVIVPAARTHSWGGVLNYPPSHLRFAVPLAMNVGFAF